MTPELRLVVEWIVGMYREIDSFNEYEKQLVENLACTVAHYQKSVV